MTSFNKKKKIEISNLSKGGCWLLLHPLLAFVLSAVPNVSTKELSQNFH
jgi:hypothetical protein